MSKILSQKKVVCPCCGSILSVRNRTGAPSTECECPKCGQTLAVNFIVAEADTAPVREGANTLLPDKGRWPVSPGRLQAGGITKELRPGRNIVGKQADTSRADIQFPLDDTGVSREHFDINVRQRTDGAFRVSVSPHKERISYTTVDGLPIQYGGEVLLREGSVIKAHHTRFVYTSKEQPQS